MELEVKTLPMELAIKAPSPCHAINKDQCGWLSALTKAKVTRPNTCPREAKIANNRPGTVMSDKLSAAFKDHPNTGSRLNTLVSAVMLTWAIVRPGPFWVPKQNWWPKVPKPMSQLSKISTVHLTFSGPLKWKVAWISIQKVTLCLWLRLDYEFQHQD